MSLLSTVKVFEQAAIQRERRLAAPGDVLVKEGDRVTPETVLAKAEFVRGNPYVVDLWSELKMKADYHLVDDILLKKQGDIVKAGEVIARYQKSFWSGITEVKSPCHGFVEYISKTKGRIIIREDPRFAKPMSVVPAASRLGIRPRFLKMFSTVKEGDLVYEGKVIATTDGREYIYAPISGVVQRICSLTGTITIVKPIKITKLLAHIGGRVGKIIPNYGAVIDTFGAYIQGVFGIGRETFGELLMVSGDPQEPLCGERIDGAVKDKILVCGSFAPFESINRAREKGAVGLITGGMNQLDLVHLSGKELTPEPMNSEHSDFTIVILEGFGEIAMNQKAWEILSQRAGKVASINGTTQIRAGVRRPEIIIGIQDGSSDAVMDEGSKVPVVSQDTLEVPFVTYADLCLGDRVRCTRPPYFGLWGTIKALPVLPQKIECEAVLEVAEVELDDGTRITVPQANLEVFQKT